MHACDAKVPNLYENEIDGKACLAGKIFGKTRILSCNCSGILILCAGAISHN